MFFFFVFTFPRLKVFLICSYFLTNFSLFVLIKFVLIKKVYWWYCKTNLLSRNIFILPKFCGKMRTRKNSVFGHFSCSDDSFLYPLETSESQSFFDNFKKCWSKMGQRNFKHILQNFSLQFKNLLLSVVKMS